MTPDVEAIFVSRGAEGSGAAGSGAAGSGAEGSGAEGSEAFLLPIDECYALVGELRMRWQGFDGGAEARASIAAFLDGLRRRAVALAPGER
jgi:hypothetical protein